MLTHRLISGALTIMLLLAPVSAAAQNDMTVDVTASVTCNEATLRASIEGGTGPYILTWDFGDTETQQDLGISKFPFTVMHEYPEPGDFALELLAMDSIGTIARTSETILIDVDGPSVTLTSEPFPPMVVLENGQATVNFSTEVSGGIGPYAFTWDLDGDGSADPADGSGAASFTYTAAGKYQASVQVTDDCGLMGSDTLPIVVIDPDEEACHPMAQRIADGVSTLFPGQANDLYTCEDILDMVRGGLTGSQLGFGRLWHAYKLAQIIEDLTWEEIRDWKLDGNGWGGLTQLNRFAEFLGEHGIRELVGLVISGDATIGEIRHSVRSVLRYEADFEDALARLGDGTSPGELGRFYRTAQDLQLDPDQLDGYLTDGVSLQELNHAARLAERSDSDWTQVVEAHAAGNSWGEIGQAQRQADDGDWMSVLDTGIRGTREQLREEDRTEREQERTDRTAEQLGARYGIGTQEVLDLYNGDCVEDWGCVRKSLREPVESSETVSDQDQKAVTRLARQYGVDESKVRSLYDGLCGGSWSCVRAELRADSGRGGGKKPKD
ncbi:MAG: hypothetical protein IIA89_11555 [Chloroflexi bacterium]|nr:hypothetical protein [Chloroflexota bacterium]